MMVPFIMSAVLSPFLGGVVDRIGQRSTLMLISAMGLTAVHIFFALAPGVDCPGIKHDVCFAESAAGMNIDISWYAQPAIGLVVQVRAHPHLH